MPQSSPPTLAQPQPCPDDRARIENDPEVLIKPLSVGARANSTRGARRRSQSRAEIRCRCPWFVKKQRWSWVIERSDLYDLYDLYDL